jgi:hypothetical protein
MESITAPRSMPRCHEVELDLGRVHFDGFAARLNGTILCAETPPRHTNEPRIRELHHRWARHTGLASEAVVELLSFWRLWTDCAVNLSPEAAVVISDYCLMYTVLDDAAERFFSPEGQDVAIAESAMEDFMAILRGRSVCRTDARSYPMYEPLCAALADLRKRISEHASPTMYPALVDGVDRYRRGVLQQIYLSRRNIPISRETQLYNRRLNVAFDPTVVLVCMLNGVDFERNLGDHPLLERVHMAICRLGAVINDIISFPKEAAEGEERGRYHNLVAAEFADGEHREGSSNPLQSAIVRTFEFHNEEMRDLLLLGRYIREDTVRMSAHQAIGLSMHRSWMNWCLEAPRYRQAFGSTSPIVHERSAMQATGPHRQAPDVVQTVVEH